MNTLIQFIDRINEWQGRLFSSLIVFATFQVCYELVRRYFFNSPTVWGLEMTIYLCAVTYVMAGAYAHKHNAHLKVDILHMRLSKRAMAFIDILVCQPIFFYFVSVLAWQSGVWALESIERGTTSGSIWDPPIWPLRCCLFLGTCLLFLQGVASLLRDLTVVFGKESQS